MSPRAVHRRQASAPVLASKRRQPRPLRHSKQAGKALAQMVAQAVALLGQPPRVMPLAPRPPHRSRNNPAGQSACNAANDSPRPPPLPPTRCAVAMAAAPGKARACAIPIHKEN